LRVAAAGDVRGDHVLVLGILSSPTAGVPSQPRIWDVPLDGSPPRLLVAYTRGTQIFTDYDRIDLSRQLSADGRQLVLSDATDVVGSGLIIVDLIAGKTRRIAISGGSDQPAWSPDGQRIAYRGFTLAGPFQKESGIWVVPASGGNPQQVWASDLAAGAGATTLWGWTQDATAIAFARGNSAANVIEIATGKVTSIGGPLKGIAWRTRRPSVALVVDEQEDRPNAPLVGRVEIRETAIAAATVIARYGPTEGTFLVAPQWHPSNDDLLLFYAAGAGVATRNEIVIIDSIVTAKRRLTTTTTPRSATWSADGAQIIYGDLAAMHVMNADSSNDHELFRPAAPPGAQLFLTAVRAFAPR
jgi:Tol biopolymer transport system component